MKKKANVTILILSVVVAILSITVLNVLTEPQPKLVGSYQSETTPPNIFMLSFYPNGTYEVYYNSNLVDEGEYEQVDTSEAYILASKDEKQLIYLIKEDAFYYYSPEQEAYLMKNISKTPASLNNPE